MDYSPEKRRHIKSALIFALCTITAATASHALYVDFNQSAGDGLGPSMATIERSESKVRRKPSTSFAWSAVRSEEKLYRKDSVQTSAASGASIRFLDGTLLELGENSLVVIDEIQKLSLDYIKGSVILHTAEGDKQVSVGTDGKAKLIELPIRLLKPEPLARYYTAAQDAKPVHFSWKLRKNQTEPLPDSVELEISPDRQFAAAKIRSLPIQDMSQTTESDVPLPEGAYYWRLAAEGRALTEMGQFRVVSAKPLHPVSPSESSSLSTFGDQISTQFRWMIPEESAIATQAKHEVQLSNSQTFDTLLKTQEISAAGGVATIHGLGTGKMWWRIVSRYGDIQVMSPALGFAVAQEQSPTLALILPESEKPLEKLPSIRFSWRSDAEGVDYGIQIKDSQDKIVASEQGPNTGYLWKNPGTGAFRWRVTAYLKSQRVAETEWRSFSIFEGARIALQAPTKGQGIYYWEEPSSFDFKWAADELVTRQPDLSYQVQIANNAEFKSPLDAPTTRATSLAKRKIDLPAGQYYWRVAVTDEKGQMLKASETWKFNYGNYPELEAPNAITPPNRAVYDLGEQEQTPVASWGEVKDAQAYEVTLFAGDPGRAPAAAKPVFKTVTHKPSAEFRGLAAGSYYWTVKALDRIQRGGKSMLPRPFTITEGEALEAPEVTSPEVQ